MTLCIAYQGEPGAYSEQAAYEYFGEAITCLPCPDFQALPRALANHDCDYAIIPIENALAGTVIGALDTISNAEVYIVGELSLPIHHCLLGLPGSSLESIKQVYSHPQALSQSQQFLVQQGLTACAFHDTAGAAAWIGKQSDHSLGAIASHLAAKRYDLQILADHIEDKAFNQTRFLIIDRKPQEILAEINKTSLLFILKHEPNALATVLTQLGEYHFNLTKITSRPSRETAWQYQFFIEFTWDIAHKNRIDEALVTIAKHCQSLKSFGHYPARIGIT